MVLLPVPFRDPAVTTLGEMLLPFMMFAIAPDAVCAPVPPEEIGITVPGPYPQAATPP